MEVAAPPRISAHCQQQNTGQILVVGLGNTLLADDGVGVHVVRHLAIGPYAPAGLSLVDGGTLGFRLMDVVMRSDAVLFVDAAELSAPAGTIRLLEQDALTEHVRRGGRISAHEAGLVDLLTLARLDGWSPKKLAVLAIQPQRVDWDEQLSEPVARSLPRPAAPRSTTVSRWQFSRMTDFASLADDGLVDALLMEVAGLLHRLIEHGEAGTIDLRGLPLSPSCIANLEQRLGQGEITVQLDAAGRSEIRETGFPGVWWTRHADEAGRVIAMLIEVAVVPDIAARRPR